jgi:hypothetical protein
MFWGKERKKRALQYAILQGEISGLLAILNTVIEHLPVESRVRLLESLQYAAVTNLNNWCVHIDEEYRQKYHEALSMMLRNCAIQHAKAKQG